MTTYVWRLTKNGRVIATCKTRAIARMHNREFRLRAKITRVKFYDCHKIITPDYTRLDTGELINWGFFVALFGIVVATIIYG